MNNTTLPQNESSLFLFKDISMFFIVKYRKVNIKKDATSHRNRHFRELEKVTVEKNNIFWVKFIGHKIYYFMSDYLSFTYMYSHFKQKLNSSGIS